MREKILEFMRKSGPIVPTDLTREIKADSMIASAHLSDLLTNKFVKLSNLKFGGSRLYYLPEHKEQLEKYMDQLHPQEKSICLRLKQEGVLREETLPPVARVGLRNAKDFAVPLEVSFSDHKEIFWKWHMLTNEQASESIKKLVSSKPAEVVRQEPPPQVVQTPPQPQQPAQPVAQPEPTPPPKQEVQEPIPAQPQVPKEEYKEPALPRQEPIPQEVVNEPKVVAPKPKEAPKVKKEEKEQTTIPLEIDDPLIQRVAAFLETRGVIVLEAKVEKAKSEADLIIQVPTPIGTMKFYCKVKDKKRLNEMDLGQTFAQAAMKQLPGILIATGSLTKKAEEKLDKDFRNVLFVQC